jgi:hypothetical protein
MTTPSHSVFDDPRSRRAEERAFEAERCERRGEFARARELYLEAAENSLSVALDVQGLPRVRSVLAVSAVCLFRRAGRYDRAIEAAERLLAEDLSLTEEAAHELRDIVRSSRALLASEPIDAVESPTAKRLRAERPLLDVRAMIRQRAAA